MIAASPTPSDAPVCEACNEAILDDLHSVRVVRMQRFVPAGPGMEDTAPWVGQTPQFFHRRHAPAFSSEWRFPNE